MTGRVPRHRRGGATLAVLLGLATTAQAAEPACPAAPIPHLRVDIVPQEPVYDRSLMAGELRTLDASASPDWLRGRGKLLGFTQHRIAVDFGALTAITAPAAAAGGTCVGFRDGTLALLASVTIHLAAEIPVGSCLDRETVAHELKHHERGLQLLDAHARDLEARFAEALAEQPFVLAAAGDAAAAAIGRLRQIMEPARREFDDSYVSAQLALDTPREYQRILDACPGEQQRLLGP